MHSTSIAVTVPAIIDPATVACNGCGVAAGQPCAPLCIDHAAHEDQLGATHFRVEATEMLFDHPEPCPTHPGLTWDGVAAATAPANTDGTEDGAGPEHHLIVTVDGAKGPVRAYLGPDQETIARRGLILIAALRTHDDAPDLVDQVGILTWLADAWISFHQELEATTRSGAADDPRQPAAGPGSAGDRAVTPR